MRGAGAGPGPISRRATPEASTGGSRGCPTSRAATRAPLRRAVPLPAPSRNWGSAPDPGRSRGGGPALRRPQSRGRSPRTATARRVQGVSDEPRRDAGAAAAGCSPPRPFPKLGLRPRPRSVQGRRPLPCGGRSHAGGAHAPRPPGGSRGCPTSRAAARAPLRRAVPLPAPSRNWGSAPDPGRSRGGGPCPAAAAVTRAEPTHRDLVLSLRWRSRSHEAEPHGDAIQPLRRLRSRAQGRSPGGGRGRAPVSGRGG